MQLALVRMVNCMQVVLKMALYDYGKQPLAKRMACGNVPSQENRIIPLIQHVKFLPIKTNNDSDDDLCVCARVLNPVRSFERLEKQQNLQIK